MSVTGITPPSSSKSREEREAAEPGSPRVVPRVGFAFSLSKSKTATDFVFPRKLEWLDSSDKKSEASHQRPWAGIQPQIRREGGVLREDELRGGPLNDPSSQFTSGSDRRNTTRLCKQKT